MMFEHKQLPNESFFGEARSTDAKRRETHERWRLASQQSAECCRALRDGCQPPVRRGRARLEGNAALVQSPAVVQVPLPYSGSSKQLPQLQYWVRFWIRRLCKYLARPLGCLIAPRSPLSGELARG